MIKTGRIVFFFLILFTFSFAFAEVKVNVSVDRSDLFKEDTLTYMISVSSNESVAVSKPVLSKKNKDFDILNSWTSSQSSTTFSNGKVEKVVTQVYNYMLSPKRLGKLTIHPSTVNVSGDIFKTNPIKIKVVKNDGKTNLTQKSRSRSRRKRGLNPFDDMEDLFSQMLGRRGGMFDSGMRDSRREPFDPENSFFIKVEVDKSKVFVGEQVVATWYIYTRGHVRDIDTLKYPSLNGFWKEDIEIATRLNFKREKIDGLVYNKALLASYALFPLSPGVVTIDPYKARCGIIFPNSRMGRAIKNTKQSQELAVEVLPLPEKGRDDYFLGVVGDFGVTSNVDTKSVPANQPLKFTLNFQGQGNAKLIKLPALDLPENLTFYDKKSDAKFYRSGKSFKKFEILLVPKEAGEVVIPSFEFTAFNTESKEYYPLKTKPHKIMVIAGKKSSEIESVPLQASTSGGDEGPYQPSLITSKSAMILPYFGRSETYFWLGIYTLLFIALALFILKRLGLTEKKNTLKRLVQSKFDKIDREYKSEGNWRDVGSELINMLYLCLGVVSDEGASGLDLESLLKEAPPSVKRELESLIRKKMKTCETLTFAPEEIVGDVKAEKNVKSEIKEVGKLVDKIIELGFAGDRGVERSV